MRKENGNFINIHRSQHLRWTRHLVSTPLRGCLFFFFFQMLQFFGCCCCRICFWKEKKNGRRAIRFFLVLFFRCPRLVRPYRRRPCPNANICSSRECMGRHLSGFETKKKNRRKKEVKRIENEVKIQQGRGAGSHNNYKRSSENLKLWKALRFYQHYGVYKVRHATHEQMHIKTTMETIGSNFAPECEKLQLGWTVGL